MRRHALRMYIKVAAPSMVVLLVPMVDAESVAVAEVKEWTEHGGGTGKTGGSSGAESAVVLESRSWYTGYIVSSCSP